MKNTEGRICRDSHSGPLFVCYLRLRRIESFNSQLSEGILGKGVVLFVAPSLEHGLAGLRDPRLR